MHKMPEWRKHPAGLQWAAGLVRQSGPGCRDDPRDMPCGVHPRADIRGLPPVIADAFVRCASVSMTGERASFTLQRKSRRLLESSKRTVEIAIEEDEQAALKMDRAKRQRHLKGYGKLPRSP